MTDADLARTVDAAWEARDGVSPSTRGAYRDAVEAVLEGLDAVSLSRSSQAASMVAARSASVILSSVA